MLGAVAGGQKSLPQLSMGLREEMQLCGRVIESFDSRVYFHRINSIFQSFSFVSSRAFSALASIIDDRFEGSLDEPVVEIFSGFVRYFPRVRRPRLRDTCEIGINGMGTPTADPPSHMPATPRMPVCVLRRINGDLIDRR